MALRWLWLLNNGRMYTFISEKLKDKHTLIFFPRLKCVFMINEVIMHQDQRCDCCSSDRNTLPLHSGKLLCSGLFCWRESSALIHHKVWSFFLLWQGKGTQVLDRIRGGGGSN